MFSANVAVRNLHCYLRFARHGKYSRTSSGAITLHIIINGVIGMKVNLTGVVVGCPPKCTVSLWVMPDSMFLWRAERIGRTRNIENETVIYPTVLWQIHALTIFEGKLFDLAMSQYCRKCRPNCKITRFFGNVTLRNLLNLSYWATHSSSWATFLLTSSRVTLSYEYWGRWHTCLMNGESGNELSKWHILELACVFCHLLFPSVASTKNT